MFWGKKTLEGWETLKFGRSIWNLKGSSLGYRFRMKPFFFYSVNDRISPYFVVLLVSVWQSYISVWYTAKHSRLRREKRSYTIPVYRVRFSPSTIVFHRIRSRRYTIVIRTQVIRQKAAVYDRKRIVEGRLKSCAESTSADNFIFHITFSTLYYVSLHCHKQLRIWFDKFHHCIWKLKCYFEKRKINYWKSTTIQGIFKYKFKILLNGKSNKNKK